MFLMGANLGSGLVKVPDCANSNKGIGVVSLYRFCCLLLCCPSLFCGSLVSLDIMLAASSYLQLHGGSTTLNARDKFWFLLPLFCVWLWCYVFCVLCLEDPGNCSSKKSIRGSQDCTITGNYCNISQCATEESKV